MGRRAWLGILVLLVPALAACNRPADSHYVFDGQSLNNSPVGGPTYPQMAMMDRTGWDNVAISGYSWTRLAMSASTRLFPLATSGHDTLVMCGGFSDILGERNTAAQLYADEVAYANAARAAGFERVVITTLPASIVFPSDVRVQRVEHNQLLLQDPEHAFDAVVDLEIPGLDDPLNSQFYEDGTHWTAVAAGVAAAAVRQKL